MKIKDLLHRRSDLGTFLVHLTRDADGVTARDRLYSILSERTIRAVTPMGHAVKTLDRSRIPADSQRCSCFTETPLEHASLLLEPIEGRSIELQPYGLAITKRMGRMRGVNPVWYVDITPGHHWLSNHINQLIEEAVASGAFDESSIAYLAPYIEQMGRQEGAYRKEFWWEREWRYRGDFSLPERVIVLCPEEDVSHYSEIANWGPYRATFIDPRWGLEHIIATLAGFGKDEIELL